MSSTISGAGQTLTLGGVAMHGVGNGFSGLNFTRAAGSFDSVSGGLSFQSASGYVVIGGSFSVNETDTTETALLCQGGQRVACVWSDGATSPTTKNFEAIIEITRTANERGAIVFAVTLYVDGDDV